MNNTASTIFQASGVKYTFARTTGQKSSIFYTFVGTKKLNCIKEIMKWIQKTYQARYKLFPLTIRQPIKMKLRNVTRANKMKSYLILVNSWSKVTQKRNTKEREQDEKFHKFFTFPSYCPSSIARITSGAILMWNNHFYQNKYFFLKIC